jgi:hypothetical protein
LFVIGAKLWPIYSKSPWYNDKNNGCSVLFNKAVDSLKNGTIPSLFSLLIYDYFGQWLYKTKGSFIIGLTFVGIMPA